MRYLVVLALVAMMVFSSLAMTRKALMVAEIMHDEQKRRLDDHEDHVGEDQNGNHYDNFKNTGENHHNIPRKDFGKYMGNNNNNGNGSG